jgi:DNA invertase Pin-like site-specific DNA recombinase
MARPRGSKRQREQKERLATGAGKVIGYIRVSTADQGTWGHSLHGQRERLAKRAADEGLELTDVVAEVASGSKARDGLAEVQRRVIAGEAQGIIFPKIDRLGRSMIHLLKIVEWAEAERVDLLSSDEGWQVRNGEKVDRMLPFRCAMAQVERERIGERTREGLAAARSKGATLGRPAEHVGDVAALAVRLRKRGLTIAEVTKQLNAKGFRTARGKEFGKSSVYYLIQRIDPAALPEGTAPGKALAAV